MGLDDPVQINQRIDIITPELGDHKNNNEIVDHPDNVSETSEDNITQSARDSLDLDKKVRDETNKQEHKISELVNSDDPFSKIVSGKKKKKSCKQLMSDCLTLEDALQKTHRGLTRMDPEDLKQYLAELIKEAAERVQENQMVSDVGTPTEIRDAKGKLINEMKEEIKEHRQEKNNEINANRKDQFSESLYRLNFIMLSALEKVTYMTQEKTGSSTVGSVDKLKEQKEKGELMKIYAQMYVDHKEIVEKYIGPISQLMMINAMILVETVQSNIKKKSQMNQQK